MTSTVTCYKNTGFDFSNRPSSANVLALADSTTYPSVWVYQELDRTQIKIKASYDEVKSVDYVKIGDVYYIVINLQMETEQTATFTLAVDPILSMGGVSSLVINGGWEVRAHVSADGIFTNVLPEPFVPTARLERTAPRKMTQFGDYNEAKRIVAATVDLTQVKNFADQYYDAASEATALVSIPRTPQIKYETKCSIRDARDGSSVKSYVLPVTTLYALENEDIQLALTKARSLGIDGAITACYMLPIYGEIEYSINDNKTYIEIKTIGQTITFDGITEMLYKYGSSYTPKNNKVYALYNSYEVVSVGSGEIESYDAHDLYYNDAAPTFVLDIDPSPKGRPYVGPLHFMGGITQMFQNSVAGSQWLNNPLGFAEASGSLIGLAGVARAANDIGHQQGMSAIRLATDFVGGGGSNNVIGGIMGSVGNILDGGRSSARQAQELNVQHENNYYVVAPDVKFPADPEIQGYAGNNFFITHVHLGSADLERFDNFLTQFGYRVDKKFDKADLTNRQYFNYIKTTGAVVEALGSPLRLNRLAADLFNTGVRLWHVLPNQSAMTNNPIA